MVKLRHVLATALVAVTIVPNAPAHAGGGATDVIRDLASDAAELMTREQALISLVDFSGDQSGPDTETEATLRQVDEDGYALLLQLDQLGVEVTQAIRSTMELLPRQPDATSAVLPQLVPPSVVYDGAIDDLLRIAATPSAVAPVAERSGGQPFGLLAVAAASLFVLGLAALANTLRRKPEAEELAAMAWSDGLTGLANRRRLDHDLASHRRAGGATSVIMVDVDHFKTVNDAHGHQTGDDVLRQVATMLTHHVRFDDVVYRYGGEEFCILLPDASIDDARAVGRRIVEAARDIVLPDASNITISVGVADGETDDLASVVEFADRALYEAKQSGRDCAVTASAAAREMAST
jgi:diguanylate cyclase (GGDEF)-like protein